MSLSLSEYMSSNAMKPLTYLTYSNSQVIPLPGRFLLSPECPMCSVFTDHTCRFLAFIGSSVVQWYINIMAMSRTHEQHPGGYEHPGLQYRTSPRVARGHRTAPLAVGPGGSGSGCSPVADSHCIHHLDTLLRYAHATDMTFAAVGLGRAHARRTSLPANASCNA